MVSLKRAFANATHHVQKAQLDWARNPTEKDRGSYRNEGVFVFENDRVPVRLIEGNTKILDGVESIVVNGHTKGQQLIKVQASDETVVFCLRFATNDGASTHALHYGL